MLVSVVSATGSQGSGVIAGLAAQGYSIRALVRDRSSPAAQELVTKHSGKVELAEATLDDLGSLERAFKDADAVYAYTPDGPEEIQRGKNIADAALAAKVGVIIWSTGLNVEAVTKGAIKGCTMLEQKDKIERYIEEIGLNHVFLRCGDFYENIPKFGLAQYDKESGQINIVLGGYVPDVATAAACISHDLGRAVDLILKNPELFRPGSSDKASPYFPETEKENDYVHLASDLYSFNILAEILERKTGKKVNLIPTPPFFPGLEILQQFTQEYSTWGKDSPLLDPKLTSLGFKPTNYEDWVIRDFIPTLGL